MFNMHLNRWYFITLKNSHLKCLQKCFSGRNTFIWAYQQHAHKNVSKSLRVTAIPEGCSGSLWALKEVNHCRELLEAMEYFYWHHEATEHWLFNTACNSCSLQPLHILRPKHDNMRLLNTACLWQLITIPKPIFMQNKKKRKI